MLTAALLWLLQLLLTAALGLLVGLGAVTALFWPLVLFGICWFGALALGGLLVAVAVGLAAGAWVWWRARQASACS